MKKPTQPVVALPCNVVFGCPRSGTTFLMRVLEAVPETACITGTLYPIGALHLAGQGLLSPEVRRVLAEDIGHSLDRYISSGVYRNRAMRVRKWVNTGGRLRDLARMWRGENAEALVYKEPFLSLAPEFVYEALPDARFVYLIRDGRDCAASLVKSYDVLTDEKLRHHWSTEARVGRSYDGRWVPWWVEEGQDDAFMEASPYARALWMWRFMALRCEAFLRRPDVRAEGRVLQVSYERLMRDPVAEGERIAAHFGLTLGGEARRRLKTAHTSSIGNYKRWNRDEVAEAESLHGDALGPLGFDSSRSPESVRVPSPESTG